MQRKSQKDEAALRKRTELLGLRGGDMSLQWPALTTPIAPLTPAGSEEPVVGDLMSYCAKRWISDYSYKTLREFLQQNFSPNDPVGDFLRVVGGIGNAAGGRASFSATRLYQVPDLPAQTPGPYTIRLEGAAGAVLASYPFTPTQAHDQGLLNVTEIVGFRVGTRRVVLVGPTGQELGAVPVSAAAPVVNLGPMNTVLPATGVTPIAWSATDADGDGLLATIEYSADSGAHWSALATGVRGTQYDLANAELAGTHGAVSGRVRVLVSDGVHTGQSDSVPISVEGKLPSLRIVTVADGATFLFGQNVPLVAVASDLEMGASCPSNGRQIVTARSARAPGSARCSVWERTSSRPPRPIPTAPGQVKWSRSSCTRRRRRATRR